jgi:hypothetical protein
MNSAWQTKEPARRLASPEMWFIQRTLINEGLPRSVNSATYVASADDVRETLAEYLRRVVKDQREYHHKNHEKQHKLHERFHKLSMGLFGATVLAVLAHFAIHANWLLICTAFFPALAAAVHGLATKLEITRIAGQSAATEHQLAAIDEAIKGAGAQAGWEGWLRLRELALEASRIMSEENGQWQQLISHQETELPA